jgi:hypothetical protein
LRKHVSGASLLDLLIDRRTSHAASTAPDAEDSVGMLTVTDADPPELNLSNLSIEGLFDIALEYQYKVGRRDEQGSWNRFFLSQIDPDVTVEEIGSSLTHVGKASSSLPAMR